MTFQPKEPMNWPEALHAAVSAIYFDDSSDFRMYLLNVIKALKPDWADALETSLGAAEVFEKSRELLNDTNEVQAIYKEMFELLVKAARRCNYDLMHATDNMEDPQVRELFRQRSRMWKNIFDPGDGIKDYRTRLHLDMDMIEMRLNRAIRLLDENNIIHDIDGLPI